MSLRIFRPSFGLGGYLSALLVPVMFGWSPDAQAQGTAGAGVTSSTAVVTARSGTVAPAANDQRVVAAFAPDQPPDDDAPVGDPVVQAVQERRLVNGVQLMTQSIPDLEHVALLVIMRTGENQDPPDAPGLNHLLDRLAITSPAKGSGATGRAEMDQAFPDGWSVKSFPTHTVLGWVIPSGEDARVKVEQIFSRIRNLKIRSSDVRREIKVLEAELEERYKTRKFSVPMSWLLAKAYRHTADPRPEWDTRKLSRLALDRIQGEWSKRITAENVSVLLCGNLADDSLAAQVADSFGALSSDYQPPGGSYVRPFGQAAIEILNVANLPGGKDHIVAAFYAPQITDPDHPAFLAACNYFQRHAAEMPGAVARLPFQYSMLLDPRAAYLTPHPWRYPKGPGQALGWWSKRLESRTFANSEGRRTLGKLAWQLGDDLSPTFIAEIERRPELLYTIAYATVFRSLHGDSEFWSSYRQRLARLRRGDLAEARDKYLSDDNRALFVLRAKSP